MEAGGGADLDLVGGRGQVVNARGHRLQCSMWKPDDLEATAWPCVVCLHGNRCEGGPVGDAWHIEGRRVAAEESWGGEAQHSLATTVTPTSPSMAVWLTFGRARAVLWQLEPSGGGQDQRHPDRDARPLRSRRLRLQRVSPDGSFRPAV